MLGYGYYFDPTYFLVIIGAVLSIWASARVNNTFSKYSRVRSMTGMTGAEAARMIRNYNGLGDVQVEHVSGSLTDHYDPRTRVLRLSDSTYASGSVAAIGVAAHGCGHAVQHKEGYVPLKIRGALVPVANFGSMLGLPIVVLGLVFGLSYTFIQIGIWIFAASVLFQIVTLPVEFNASGRALKMLQGYNILTEEETGYCRKVLGAAALLRGRKERTEEKLAEAEHLLTDAAPVQQSLPRRWITLYLSTRRGIAETRWSAYVESSLIIGSDATQCDLCLADGRTRPQHAVLEVESSGVTLRPLDEAAVMVNGDPIGGEYRLQNGDTIKIGRTTLRLVL